jgi:hypothetical protein
MLRVLFIDDRQVQVYLLFSSSFVLIIFEVDGWFEPEELAIKASSSSSLS